MMTSALPRRIAAVAGGTAVLAATAVASLPEPAQAAVSWQRVQAFHSGLAAQVVPPWTGNNLPVEQAAFSANSHDAQWTLMSTGVAGYYQFKNRFSNQCLDVNGNSLLENVAVVQNPCNVADLSQHWEREQDPVLPVWHIQNRRSGRYLTVLGGSRASGTRLVQSSNTPGAANEMFQMW